MMDDLISRHAAIDALNEYFSRIGKLKRKGLTKGEKAIGLDTVGVIKSLPSDIVRCKDCKHYMNEFCFTCRFHISTVAENDFCSYGERREDDAVD